MNLYVHKIVQIMALALMENANAIKIISMKTALLMQFY